VSVKVTPVSGTATAGSDFDSTSVVVSWADGDSDTKEVDIPITNDSTEEASESFTVQLSDATGGALVGAGPSIEIAIDANDQPPPPPPPGSGGGGSFGYLSLLMLSAARLLGSLKERRQTESPTLGPKLLLATDDGHEHPGA
jgi:hypothetical protein